MFTVYKYKSKKDKLWIRVSKRVSRRAVDRNRLRRQVRAILAEMVTRDLSQYIIDVNKEALGQPYSILKDELIGRLPHDN